VQSINNFSFDSKSALQVPHFDPMASVRDRVSQLTGSKDNLVVKPIKPSALEPPASIAPDTNYSLLVLYRAGRFAQFTLDQVTEFKDSFNKFDVNKDGYLSLEEVKGMMEKLGVTKTHLETKAMIKEVDKDQDGKVGWEDFLEMNAPEAVAGVIPPETEFHRIYKGGLSSHAKFHESSINASRDLNMTAEEKIHAEAAERKRMKEIRAQALAAEEKEVAAKAAAEQAKKDRLKAKAAMFEQKV